MSEDNKELENDDAMDELTPASLSPAEERELAEAMLLQGTEGLEAGILPEAAEEDDEPDESSPEQDFSGTELEDYESTEIEEVEFIETERLESIVESILFASDRPVSMASIWQVFKGTSVKKKNLSQALENLAITYADQKRGVTLEEVTGGYQLRTKVDNMDFLKKTVKGRPFRLSGPALEVLSIVAYKQPLIKVEVDEIRGVESGHLLRALMEKGLVSFAGKSELPGKPMLYQSTRKFLEIFGLRNLKELPSLTEIDSLLPEGITEDEEKPKLADLTEVLSEDASTNSYSIGEEELGKISDQLSSIETSTDFFEEEKRRQREKRDRDRAQDIREALEMGEVVVAKDIKWLERYEQALAAAETPVQGFLATGVEFVDDSPSIDNPPTQEAASDDNLDVEPVDEPDEVIVAPKKKLSAGKKDEVARSGEIVNEKLARALAAFRESWPQEEEKKAESSDSEV